MLWEWYIVMFASTCSGSRVLVVTMHLAVAASFFGVQAMIGSIVLSAIASHAMSESHM